MKPSITIIGAGFNGLAASALLARRGHRVTVVDRHSQVGGVARTLSQDGYTFDMGPSWYLMPEVFERFFARFDRRPSDFYELKKLNPGFRVFFGDDAPVDLPETMEGTEALFESFEPGGALALRRYLADAAYKYDVAMKEFLYRDYRNVFSFFNARMMLEGPRLHVFDHLERHIARHFKSRRARQLLAYNIVFLGCAPKKSPALYSLMSHVDLTLGVSYPMGGIGAVVAGMRRLAEEQGVVFRTGEEVKKILVKDGKARGVETSKDGIESDLVVAAGEARHMERDLLAPEHRRYSESWWNRRVLAPSCFLLFLGSRRKLPAFLHHTLYLEPEWDRHFETIFDRPAWPDAPSWYLSATSKTDPAMAPAGGETVFVLVPIAPGLPDTPEIREAFAEKMLDRLEKMAGEPIRPHLAVRKIYTLSDFERDHRYPLGSALGHAHTLLQTAVFRVGRRTPKVKNLYFTGHGSHPGIGMPMALVGAEVCERVIAEDHP